MKSAAAWLVLSLVAFGCGPDTATVDSAAKSAGSAGKSAAPSGKPSAATSTSAAPGEHKNGGKMSNCPSSVTNAKTEIKDTDKGVEVTVTASEKADVDEIRARAKKVEEHGKAAAPSDATKGAHTGKGAAGGSMGRCPVVLNDTSVVVAEVESGSKFTIEPKDAKELDWLRREAKERLAEIGGEKGARKMGNCPSAVNGAATTVKDVGGNTVVTVTSKDEAGTKEIRERAKKLGGGKHDNAKKHEGDGSGSGGGDCPAFAEGAKSTFKDVDGGTEITITPDKKDDAKKILEEVTNRAKPFAG